MSHNTLQPIEHLLCPDCRYSLRELPVMAGGLVRCPECGREGIPARVLVKPIRPARWALLGAAIGLAPLLAIPLFVVMEAVGAGVNASMTFGLCFIGSPILVAGPLLIAAAFAAAEVRGRGKLKPALLAALVFGAGALTCAAAWFATLFYFVYTYREV